MGRAHGEEQHQRPCVIPLHRMWLDEPAVGRPVRECQNWAACRSRRTSAASMRPGRSPPPQSPSPLSIFAKPSQPPADSANLIACSAAGSWPGAVILITGEPKRQIPTRYSSRGPGLPSRGPSYVTGEESGLSSEDASTSRSAPRAAHACRGDRPAAVLTHIDQVQPRLIVCRFDRQSPQAK